MAPQRTDEHSSVRRVPILGGGFAGIYTALDLERALRPDERVAITLASRENYFLFTPFLCEVAASAIDPANAVNPIRCLLKRVQLVEGEAVCSR